MRYKRFMRLCSVLLALLVLFLFCGCSQEEETGAGYLFSAVLPGNPECLDPQFTQNPNAGIVLTNMMEGLMRLDAGGTPVPAGAESYSVSEDGLTYLFTLRSNAYWFGKNMDPDRPEHVTSRDYVFAFQRLVDPAMRSPYGKEVLCLKNAAAILEGKEDPQSLGVSAPDGSTVLFELEYPDPEFLTRLTRTFAVPCSESFFESTDGRYGLDENTILCNGAFYLTKWNYDPYSSGNFLTFKKCRHYHSPDNVYPSSLQFNIMHSRDAADADFAEGNDDVLLTPLYHKEYLYNKDYSVQSAASITLGLIFNPAHELLTPGLRQALAMSIDRKALDALVGEDVQMAYGIVPPAVNLLGSSYRSIEADEPLAPGYDPERAAWLFAQSAESLGLSSLNTIRILVPSTFVDTDVLLAMCQNWQDLFGYYIGIETVSPDEFQNRISAGNYSIALYSLSPPDGSLSAAMQNFADHSALFGFSDSDFDMLLGGLSRPVRLADTAELCAKMEQLALSSCTFVPLFYQNTYLITTAGNRDIRFDPFAMSADFIGAKHFSK